MKLLTNQFIQPLETLSLLVQRVSDGETKVSEVNVRVVSS